MKLDDTDKTLRVFDSNTRTFAAYNDQGMTKTFFKPDNPSYWQRQPGRVVTSADLHFSLR
jgi:pyocin large subunit-like protein